MSSVPPTTPLAGDEPQRYMFIYGRSSSFFRLQCFPRGRGSWILASAGLTQSAVGLTDHDGLAR